MKKICFLAALLLAAAGGFAQTPQKFNYQAIPRDLNGDPLTNTQISLQMSVLDGGPNGNLVYSERHFLNTGPLGLVNVQIGGGQVVSGAFSAVSWETGGKWLKVEIDPAGGFNFQPLSTLEFLSVPFALFAENARNATDVSLNELTDVSTTGVLPGQVLKWDGATWIPQNDVGGGAGDNWGAQVVQTAAGLSGNGTAAAPLNLAQQGATNGQVLKWSGTAWMPANESSPIFYTPGAGIGIAGNVISNTGDLSNTNELQTLLLNGSTLELSNGGGSVNLPAGTTYTAGTGISIAGNVITNTGDTDASNDLTSATQAGGDLSGPFSNLQIAASAVGNAELANAAVNGSKIAQMGAADGQVLKWNGSAWAPQNDVGGGAGDNWGVQVVQTAPALSGDGTATTPLNLAQQGASSGQVLKWNGASWAPAADNNQTFSAGTGISIAGNVITNTGDTDASNDLTSASTAGGDLSGPFSNLQIGASAVGTTELAADAVTSARIANNTIVAADLNSMSATNGQVLKYNGSAWAPAADNGQTYTAGTGISIAGSTINSTWTTSSTDIYNNNSGRVGIGTSGPLVAPLTVRSNNVGSLDAILYASYDGSNSSGNPKIAVFGSSTGGGAGIMVGVQGVGYDWGVYGEGAVRGVGGFVNPNGSGSYRGVYGSVGGGTGTNYGVYGNATGGSAINFGLYGTAEVGSSAASSAGVYGTCTGNGNGVVGEANGAGAYSIWGKSTAGEAGHFNGSVNIIGSLSKSSGTFKIDHPLDPANRYLYHSFVESPDMMNIYNGNTTTDAGGFATVELPSYFEALNMEFRYQLTAIGTFAQAIIFQKIRDNQFVIQTDKPNVEVSWQVTGVRNDPYAIANRVVPEVEKEPENRGRYLHPEVYGLPENAGIDYERAANLRETREKTERERANGDQGQSPNGPDNPNPKN